MATAAHEQTHDGTEKSSTRLLIPQSYQTPNFYADKLKRLLTPEQYAVLDDVARCVFGWQVRSRPVSVSQVAERCDMDVKTVRKHMKFLKQAGIIRVDDRPGKSGMVEPAMSEEGIQWEGLAACRESRRNGVKSRLQKAQRKAERTEEATPPPTIDPPQPLVGVPTVGGTSPTNGWEDKKPSYKPTVVPERVGTPSASPLAPVSPGLQPYYSLVRRFCKYETAHLKPQRHAQILEQAQTCLDAEYPLPFLTEYVTWVHEERWPGIRPWPSQFFDFLDAFTEVYETRDAEARAEEEHERKVAERERLEEEKERRDAAEQAEASLQVKARKKQKLLDYQISLMRTFNAPREFYENLSEPYDPERLKAMLLPLARAESQTAGGTAHG